MVRAAGGLRTDAAAGGRMRRADVAGGRGGGRMWRTDGRGGGRTDGRTQHAASLQFPHRPAKSLPHTAICATMPRMTRTLVCFGDSYTEGRIGASYVELLRAALGPEVHIVNAGVDGDTTLNLARRIDRDVLPHHPDVLLLLVGANDLASAYGGIVQKLYYRTLKRLPFGLPPARYAAAYRLLLDALRAKLAIPIVLCTPSAFGETLDAPQQLMLDRYAEIVRAFGREYGMQVIDLRDAFRRRIAALERRDDDPYYILRTVSDTVLVRRGWATYEDLAARRGWRLLVDGAHLSQAGAELTTATMLPTLREVLR